jgi:hypothetical protein
MGPVDRDVGSAALARHSFYPRLNAILDEATAEVENTPVHIADPQQLDEVVANNGYFLSQVTCRQCRRELLEGIDR